MDANRQEFRHRETDVVAQHGNGETQKFNKGIRRWFTPWRLIFAAVGLLVVLFVLAWIPIRVAYHRWQVERLISRNNAFDNPTTLDGIEERIAGSRLSRISHHLTSLTALGGVIRHQFHFKHVHFRTERHRTLYWTLTRGACPPSIHQGNPAAVDPTIVVLTVWCEPEDSDAWREFVTNFDVPHEDDTIPLR